MSQVRRMVTVAAAAAVLTLSVTPAAQAMVRPQYLHCPYGVTAGACTNPGPVSFGGAVRMPAPCPTGGPSHLPSLVCPGRV